MTEERSGAKRWTMLWLALSALVVMSYMLMAINGARGPGYVSNTVSGAAGVLIVVLPICLLGLLASMAVVGPSGARSGLRYLLGRAKEAEFGSAARALGAAGNLVMNLGIAAGFVALLSHYDHLRVVWEAVRADQPQPMANPADMAFLFRGILVLQPLGILVGRMVLGAAGESAALRAGVAPPRFSTGAQFAAALCVPIFSFTLFLTFPDLAQ